jgi:endonuclease/exonuclease/phosphatase family metal-dependent hydrolase
MTERSSARWRILTWNLHGSAHPNLELVAEVVEGYAPHVVALQEVQRRQARRLAKRLGWQHVWARKHHPYSPLVWWRTEGLAVLSPHPTSHVVRTTISHGASTWTYRHRILLAVTVNRPDSAVRVYDTHLASDDDVDERITQARRVAEHVAQDAAPIAVVAGDLNTNHADELEVVREFHPAGLRDPGGESTNPSRTPRQRLDRVLVPVHAGVVDAHVPEGGDSWAAISDHLPVMVEFDA